MRKFLPAITLTAVLGLLAFVGPATSQTNHQNRIECYVPASTATTITAVGGSCAAPGAGRSINITDVSFSSSAASGTAADSYPTLKSGTGGTCGTATTVVYGGLSVANTTLIHNYTQPIKLTRRRPDRHRDRWRPPRFSPVRRARAPPL